MEYYSALKINELSNHEITWKNLKCILPSERSQSENIYILYNSTIRQSGKGKNVQIIS